MDILTKQLDDLIQKQEDTDSYFATLESLQSVLPFNRYEYVISTLLARNKLSYAEYLEIRDSYIDRNLYLYVFEISSPRGYGDTWALAHLMEIENRLHRPGTYDRSSKGKYDLCTMYKEKLIRIEVKASRANDRDKPNDPLYEKALSSGSKNNFLMNFQQMKPSCCDVFVWIAAYRDKLQYWVINSNDIQQHPLFTPQHRNAGTEFRAKDYAKVDIFEGQIMVTNDNISRFDSYKCTSSNLYRKIIKAYTKLS